ncbi:FHIPEP family type III secretion protein, partial [Enterobacter sp. JH23]|uniref:FHIPEP family type III secretion protein n=1 Tax=Enterobacter sp. JH23 TaxID=2923087 RepID=UPI00208FEC95
MAEVINKQILASPSVLYMTSGVMFIIGSVPNMPHLAFYSFSVTVGFVAWRQSKKDEGVDLSKAEV